MSDAGTAPDTPLPSLAEDLARIAPAPTAPELDDLDEFGPRLTLKDVRQLRALKAYVASGRVNTACKAAQVQYSTWYRWIAEDRDFARAFEQAKEMLADDLEGVAVERAKEGSDTLLITLLKALKPEKYRDKQTITIVSPDVQGRLSRQADAIMEVCRTHLPREQAAAVASMIANRLREIWA
ncbi:MAG: hypothetical protein JWM41_2884 [Gemmatimonadetes bacterium]|nr:hypothetical protein [Gemmatimonadota bacterium]